MLQSTVPGTAPLTNQATTEYPPTPTTNPPVIVNVTANSHFFNISAVPLVMTSMESRLAQMVSMTIEIKVNSVGEVDLAVYGRKNYIPTHTRYDFTRVLVFR